MHRGVKQRCVRCIVQLSLHKVSWTDNDSRDVHLSGPMVFLRACVLGQLQHSHLHQPLFPIELDQQLQFDRVFTNCKNPLLFNEMIRGEHVRIEIIQLSEDCTGGRVLARYEASAHSFLFPDEPGSQSGDVRHIQLTKRSKAMQNKTPPTLSFSTSTILLEATVHSPVSPPFVGGQDLRDGEDSGLSSTQASPCNNHSFPVAASTGGEALRLSALKHTSPALSKSCSEPSSAHEARATPTASEPTPAKVKFRQPKTDHPPDELGPGHEEDPHASKPLYRTVTSDVGLHPWETCPRRKREIPMARSSPALHRFSPSSETKKRSNEVQPLRNLVPVDDLRLEHTDPTLYPCSPSKVVSDLRPPFVVRHVDPSVLSRRDFCGTCSAPTVVNHSRRKSEVVTGDEDPPRPSVTVEKESGGFGARQNGPSISELYEKYLGSSVPQSVHERSPSRPEQGTSSRVTGHRASLKTEPGSVRSEARSPAKQIEEKVQRLRKECCSHVKHSEVETVVEDSLNEDLNRLRASLAAERSEVFNKRDAPHTSSTVKVGPEDYWSQRMAEYTGHSHRLLFDETLEKIYHRLYQNASAIK